MPYQLAITTDYQRDRGEVADTLAQIANAGFTHVMWCHHWGDDFSYDPSEIDHIRKLLEKNKLRVIDVHGSSGSEKNWISVNRYQQEAGILLVKNRIDMAKKLPFDTAPTVVMHMDRPPQRQKNESAESFKLRTDRYHQAVFIALQEIGEYCAYHDAYIALENYTWESVSSPLIPLILDPQYDEFLGFCYDTGHGNIGRDGLITLEILKDRLFAIHVHDNDGKDDLHKIPGSGSVQWRRFLQLLGSSSYTQCISLESGMKHHQGYPPKSFLESAYSVGQLMSIFLEKERNKK